MIQPGVILVQRQTVDWANLSDLEFHQQSKIFCALWGKPENYVWQLFQLWNKTFSIDYRQVRQQLKELSLLNFQRAQGTTFVPYQHYKNIPQQSGYYLFLDDDDWVSPTICADLHKHLVSVEQNSPLVLWRSANMGSPNQDHVVFVWGMNGRCMTNNYAVRRDWLQPFSKIDHVLQHKDAEKLFEDVQKNNVSVPHLDCALTVSNKSPISSVSLDRGLNGELTSAKLQILVQTYVDRMGQIQDKELVYLPWAKEYVQRTIEIFEKVVLNKKT